MTFRVLVTFSPLAMLSMLGACDLNSDPSSEVETSHPGVGLPGFELAETRPRRNSTVYTYKSGDDGAAASVVRIEVVRNIGTEAARRLREDGVLDIEARFAGALSPYPGDITNKIVPNERYRPLFFETIRGGREYTGYVVFADERFGYGASAEGDLRYRAVIGWFHCSASETFYKVRCFAPLEGSRSDVKALFLALECP